MRFDGEFVKPVVPVERVRERDDGRRPMQNHSAQKRKTELLF